MKWIATTISYVKPNNKTAFSCICINLNVHSAGVGKSTDIESSKRLSTVALSYFFAEIASDFFSLQLTIHAFDRRHTNIQTTRGDKSRTSHCSHQLKSHLFSKPWPDTTASKAIYKLLLLLLLLFLPLVKIIPRDFKNWRKYKIEYDQSVNAVMCW